MTTGAAWDVSDPLKPTTLFDPNAEIIFPIGVDDWLAELGTTYGSHSVILASPLELVSAGTYSGGTIPVRIRLASGAAYKIQRYGFTLRIVGADGQKDDRTLYLKVKDR